jgi:hypothetical protein
METSQSLKTHFTKISPKIKRQVPNFLFRYIPFFNIILYNNMKIVGSGEWGVKPKPQKQSGLAGRRDATWGRFVCRMRFSCD